MDEADNAERLLADRYRLPQLPSDAPDAARPTRAFDTASGQDVWARRVPLPEVVEAEVLDEALTAAGPEHGRHTPRSSSPTTARQAADGAERRAVEAALAASRLPDHPRLDQVFDVFLTDDALWIVSELVPSRPLSDVLTEQRLTAHRAAEIVDDVLAALRAVHAHGWVHRNVTAHTVLVCDDGRAVLTGLAAAAAEEALCGYEPFPDVSGDATTVRPRGTIPAPAASEVPRDGSEESTSLPSTSLPSAARTPLPAGFERGGHGMWPSHPAGGPERQHEHQPAPGRPGNLAATGTEPEDGSAARAARRGAIAAYRAGARAASARAVAESQATGGQAEEDGGTAAETDGYGPLGRPYGQPAPRPSAPANGAPWSSGAVHPKEDGASPSGEPSERAGEHHQRGPTSVLAAQRARQARMTTVGPVTERWAPEQAAPVYQNWRLAPPVGPAADLWALGALLFRAVQGQAPYPEESVTELVRLVCADPPALAEECGPLRPVVESLLRQDPTERPDFDELRGWLRSLIRSAPEPDIGRAVLAAAPSLEPGAPADPRRLPIRRRRGELVRRRRGRTRSGRPSSPSSPGTQSAQPAKPHRSRRHATREPRASAAARVADQPRAHNPRKLGRLMLTGVLLLLVATVVYAMWFMPQRQGATEGNQRRGSVGEPGEPTQAPHDEHRGEEAPEAGEGNGPDEGDREPSQTQPQTSRPTAPEGFRMHEDPTGFRIAVPTGWERRGPNDRGQVRFDKGDFELVVVKGRDSVAEYGRDPMAYQSESEPELEPYRTSDWSSASRLRRIEVGDTAMAEGTYTWQDASGRDVYVRNRAMILGGRYHVIMVMGPESERDAVDRWFEGAVDTYRVLSR